MFTTTPFKWLEFIINDPNALGRHRVDKSRVCPRSGTLGKAKEERGGARAPAQRGHPRTSPGKQQAAGNMRYDPPDMSGTPTRCGCVRKHTRRESRQESTGTDDRESKRKARMKEPGATITVTLLSRMFPPLSVRSRRPPRCNLQKPKQKRMMA